MGSEPLNGQLASEVRARADQGLMAACGQADLLNVVGDRQKGVDPRLHLWLDSCAVELCQSFLHGTRQRQIRHGNNMPSAPYRPDGGHASSSGAFCSPYWKPTGIADERS